VAQITILTLRIGLAFRVSGMHSSFPPQKISPPKILTFSTFSFPGPDRAINLEKISDLMEFFHDFIKDRDMFLGYKKLLFGFNREMVEICLFVCLFVCFCLFVFGCLYLVGWLLVVLVVVGCWLLVVGCCWLLVVLHTSKALRDQQLVASSYQSLPPLLL